MDGKADKANLMLNHQSKTDGAVNICVQLNINKHMECKQDKPKTKSGLQLPCFITNVFTWLIMSMALHLVKAVWDEIKRSQNNR